MHLLQFYHRNRHTFWSRWCKEPVLTVKSSSSSTIPWEPTTWRNLLWHFWWPFGWWYPIWSNHFFALCSNKIIHMHGGGPACVLFPLTEDIMWSNSLSKSSPSSSSGWWHNMSSLCRLYVLRFPTVTTNHALVSQCKTVQWMVRHSPYWRCNLKGVWHFDNIQINAEDTVNSINSFYLEVMKVSCLCLPSLNPFVVFVRPGDDGSDKNDLSNSACKSKSLQPFSDSSIKSTFTFKERV